MTPLVQHHHEFLIEADGPAMVEITSTVHDWLNSITARDGLLQRSPEGDAAAALATGHDEVLDRPAARQVRPGGEGRREPARWRLERRRGRADPGQPAAIGVQALGVGGQDGAWGAAEAERVEVVDGDLGREVAQETAAVQGVPATVVDGLEHQDPGARIVSRDRGSGPGRAEADHDDVVAGLGRRPLGRAHHGRLTSGGLPTADASGRVRRTWRRERR